MIARFTNALNHFLLDFKNPLGRFIIIWQAAKNLFSSTLQAAFDATIFTEKPVLAYSGMTPEALTVSSCNIH